MNCVRLLLAVALIGGISEFAFSHDGQALNRYEAAGRHMGVVFKIVLFADDGPTAGNAVRAAFQRIGQLDSIMSDYDPDSELSRLSRAAPTPSPVEVSDDLWRVLNRAQDVSKQCDGAFDVTVGPLTRLWRQARSLKQLPADEPLAEACQSVGYQHMVLDTDLQAVSLLQDNMRLDLGGIAKGYAADEALVVLREMGITRALIDAGGDIRLGEPPPGKPGWRIGVAPLEPGGPPSRFLLLANCAVATSGDAWQHVQIDGIRYSHIVDPRTGLGLTDRSSVTVIAPDCTSADALASAVSVLGSQDGIERIEDSPQTAALIVRATGQEVEVHKSKRFDEFAESDD